ncbi:MAG TPA: YncE family protein [Candidatus Binatia bacterium]|nr:YncE family protein [Candidatus Binatia bacterium]
MRYRSGLILTLLACACALASNAQSVIASISVPGVPNGIAVNPNSSRIYAAIPYISTNGLSAIAVIDGSSNTLVDTISLPSGDADFIAVNMVTGRIYSASKNVVEVIDGTSDKVMTTITLAGSGIGIQGIAVDSVHNRIYVSDDSNDELAVIDGATNAVTYVNTHNTEALGLAVDFATGQVLITPSGGALDIFNPATRAFQQVLVGQINQDVAVNSFTGFAYVTNEVGSTLGVVNLSNLQTSSITVGNAPYGVTVDYLSNLVFVAVEGDGTVVVIDGRTNALAGSVNAPSSYLDVNPATRTVYASSTNVSPNYVYAISE